MLRTPIERMGPRTGLDPQPMYTASGKTKKRAEPETEDVLLVQPVLGVNRRSECLPTVVANHKDPDGNSVVVRA